VLQRVLEAVSKQGGRPILGAVQRRGDQPVAQMKVGLPVGGIILVGKGHVPDRYPRDRRGGVTGGAGAQPVLDVIPLDEQR
jgi:hypothetical protein